MRIILLIKANTSKGFKSSRLYKIGCNKNGSISIDLIEMQESIVWG
ncbi:MAG: hypothetical protein RR851_12275 [Clostridium sp.]